MRPMNAFAAARLDMVLIRLEDTIGLLDGPVNRVPRAALLKCRGDLVAMRQLLELEAEMLEAADTERSSSLRLVK